MDTLENLRNKIEGAEELKSVVRTMKAMAASNIEQYEAAVNSLEDYYYISTLGLIAYFREENTNQVAENAVAKKNDEKKTHAIVFGSDQGLVGQFNDRLSDFVIQSLHSFTGQKEIWAVGEHVQLLLENVGLKVSKLFSVPSSIDGITLVVTDILMKSLEIHERENVNEFFIYNNQSVSQGFYKPVMQPLLPLDEKWQSNLSEIHWPTKEIPEVAGNRKSTLLALIREFLFVSLFKACAASLASENASRLLAMQRAEKNISELLDDLSHSYHSLRQTSIDEELFDVVSGVEALKKKNM